MLCSRTHCSKQTGTGCQTSQNKKKSNKCEEWEDFTKNSKQEGPFGHMLAISQAVFPHFSKTIVYFLKSLLFQFRETRLGIHAVLSLYIDFTFPAALRPTDSSNGYFRRVTNLLHPCGVPEGIQSQSALKVNRKYMPFKDYNALDVWLK